LRRFSVDEYHRMIEAGVLTADDHVELLEGWVVHKMAHGPEHDGTISLVETAIRRHLPPGWIIRIQSAVTTADSEPEPDVVVVDGPARSYMARHPGPADIALVIEVANSSLEHDRQDKARAYARANIVAYWIVNLIDRQVEIHTQPSGPTLSPAYGMRQVYGEADAVPLVIAGRQVGMIAVRELLA
jgi:Uma2 family endonuclease